MIIIGILAMLYMIYMKNQFASRKIESRLGMTKQPNKKKFEVLENETITDCLARMEQEGYAPSRRMEEPIFHEVKKDGKTVVEPCGRKIVLRKIEVIQIANSLYSIEPSNSFELGGFFILTNERLG